MTRFVDLKGKVKGLAKIKITDRKQAMEIIKEDKDKFLGMLEDFKASMVIILMIIFIVDKELGKEFKEIRDKSRDLINKIIEKIKEE